MPVRTYDSPVPGAEVGAAEPERGSGGARNAMADESTRPSEAPRAEPRPRLFSFRAALPRSAELALGVGVTVGIFVVWEAVARLGLTSALFLPAPSAVFSALVRMATTQDLLWHAWVSTARVWVAFALAAVMAIPIGMLMGGYRVIGAGLEPAIDFIRYLPVPALVPLSIIWFGVGENTKIFLLWLGTFFQLVLLVADDMRRVPHEYVETALTVGAKPWQVMRDVAFRAMLPNLVDSLRITLGWCWTYLIVAEIVAADSGIGFVIWSARRYMKTPEVMAGVVMIGLIGLATDQLLRLLHRLAFRYL
jgi:NitT/TauT family transport system permease protein